VQNVLAMAARVQLQLSRQFHGLVPGDLVRLDYTCVVLDPPNFRISNLPLFYSFMEVTKNK